MSDIERTCVCFEEHGEVLGQWHRAGFEREHVVILDRHLDFKRIESAQIERLLKVAACGPIDQLNRDLPFRDDEQYAFGLDNFLYAAVHLGFLRRVTWVLPEKNPMDAAALGEVLWNALALVPGHGDDVLSTFHVDSSAARACVAGLEIEATTLSRLAGHSFVNAKLDIDLDFFYESDDERTHEVNEVVNILSAVGSTAQPPTMTYSIHSGFMPESYRPIGAELAQAMGFSVAEPPRRPRHAERSLAVIATGKAASVELIADLTRSELSALGGPGMSLRSVLCARGGLISAAEESHAQARELGDRATWPAYELGLAHLARKNYAEAAIWLERAQGNLTDALQAHSLSLRALAACRLGAFEDGLALAEVCMREIPMKVEPYHLAAIAATRLGRVADAQRASEGLVKLQQKKEQARR